MGAGIVDAGEFESWMQSHPDEFALAMKNSHLDPAKNHLAQSYMQDGIAMKTQSRGMH